MILKIKQIFFLILFLFVSCSISRSSKIPPLAIQGVLDLSDWNFERDGIIKLDGEWEFYWKKLFYLDKEEFPSKPEKFVKVPSVWNDTVEGIDPNKAFGYATYRLKIKLNPNKQENLFFHFQNVGTSANVYANGKKILQNGIVGKTPETSIPQYLPIYAKIPDLSHELEIVIEVSNFSHHKAGTWASFRLGTEAEIQGFSKMRAYADFFLTGSILIMGLYHLGLFSLRRKDKSALYFGLFCLAITLRTITTGERVLFQFYPSIIWELGHKMEYFSLYACVPLFYLFLESTFPEEFSQIFGKIALWFHVILCAIILFTSSLIYPRTLLLFEIFLLITCFLILISLGLAVIRDRNGAIPSSLGTSMLMVTAINDVLHAELIINTGYYTPIGLFMFIFFQAYMLSCRFSSAFVEVEKLSFSLSQTNKAYSRFVPMEFLKLLVKESILDITLGDQIQKEMSIIFADIRSFTKLSSTMSPKDNFNFINSYLNTMGPVVRKNHGFIDKYIGDAIMALFPNQVEDAIQASLEMRKELKELNQERLNKGLEPIDIGIGIHVGSLMLGIIGESERMEGTVISDAVNVASRIEGLCAILKVPIIVTETVTERLKNKIRFQFRYLGKFKLKGKETETKVFEILDGEDEPLMKKKIQTKLLFEEGVLARENGNIEHSNFCFQRVLQENPDDKTASYYLFLNKENRIKKEYELS